MSGDEIGRVLDAMPDGLYIVGSRAGGEVNSLMGRGAPALARLCHAKAS